MEYLRAESLEESVEESVLEFSRLFLLRVLDGDIAASRGRGNDVSQDGKRKRIEECMHSSSESVDKVWHALLLFPGVYYHLCSQLLGNGEFIDHDPCAAGNSYCDKAARYTFTLQRYIKVFVCGLPDAYWPLPHTWATDPELCRWLLQSHESETNNHRGLQAASQHNQSCNCDRQSDIPQVT